MHTGAEINTSGMLPAVTSQLSGLAGQDIILPCSIDVAVCGEFHSVKWYREAHRVFVFSELAKLERSEGPLLNR